MPETGLTRHSSVRRWHVDGRLALEQVMHHRPGQEWAPHWHDEWSIGAVLAGRCRFSLGGRRHTASAGDLLAIAPGAVHTCGLDAGEGGDTRVVMVYAPVPWLAARGVAMPRGSARAPMPALAAEAQGLCDNRSDRDSAGASAWLSRAAAALADDRALLPGYFVRVRVPLGEEPDMLLVPDRASGSDQKGRYLLVAGKDDVVEQRPVEIGQLVGALRVITKGITAEDRVLVSGLQTAVPGQKIEAQVKTLEAAATDGAAQ